MLPTSGRQPIPTPLLSTRAKRSPARVALIAPAGRSRLGSPVLSGAAVGRGREPRRGPLALTITITIGSPLRAAERGTVPMATINLDPGEEFAHIHDVVSTTAAVRGEVELTFNGQTIRLTAVPVVIPAHTLHMMVNVGEITAVVRCGYGVGGGRR